MFAYAVGMWPYKDCFQSAAGQRTIRNERWGFEETLISNLSGGPVGPGDAIGAADRELRRAFQGLAQPSLSLRFNRELRARLQAEREHRRLLRRHWRVMQGYWLAASVASVLILLLTPWPTEAPSAMVLGFLGATAAVTLLILGVSVVASLLPALRAASVQPSEALRED